MSSMGSVNKVIKEMIERLVYTMSWSACQETPWSQHGRYTKINQLQWIQVHDRLVCKRTVNNLAKLNK